MNLKKLERERERDRWGVVEVGREVELLLERGRERLDLLKGIIK